MTPSSGLVAGGSAPNVFLAAVRWIEALLLGSLATTVAVLSVACVGLLMLGGRVNLRRGATVIVGCFILFGAASIAQGLRGAAAVISGDGSRPPPVPASPSPLVDLTRPTSNGEGGSADPYAGAAVRR